MTSATLDAPPAGAGGLSKNQIALGIFLVAVAFAIAKPVLRHRIVTNFSAEAEGMTSDAIIDLLLGTHCFDCLNCFYAFYAFYAFRLSIQYINTTDFIFSRQD